MYMRKLLPVMSVFVFTSSVFMGTVFFAVMSFVVFNVGDVGVAAGKVAVVVDAAGFSVHNRAKL